MTELNYEAFRKFSSLEFVDCEVNAWGPGKPSAITTRESRCPNTSQVICNLLALDFLTPTFPMPFHPAIRNQTQITEQTRRQTQCLQAHPTT